MYMTNVFTFVLHVNYNWYLFVGCCMADDAANGVVDHRCRVFQNKTGTETHKVHTGPVC